MNETNPLPMDENRSDPTPPSGAAMDRVVQRRNWRRRRVAIVVSLLVASLLGALWFAYVRGRGERSVRVADNRITISSVTRGEFDDFIQIRGRITPFKTIFIDTVEGGQVEAIHVENGALVKNNQLLVELSNTALELDLISREAQVTEQLNNLRGLELAHETNRLAQRRELIDVEYQIKRLTRQIDRSRGLVESGASPRGAFDDAKDELDYYKKRRAISKESQGAASKLEQAQLIQLRRAAKQLEKNLLVARGNLEGLSVRAHADGQLTAFNVEIGQSLAPGERIGQIDDPTSYKIIADVDEFYLGRVDIGQHAIYQLGGTNYELSITRIRPQVKNGRFQIDLVFDQAAPSKIRRGQTAQLRLQLGQPSKAILVPNAAFFHDTGGAWVFVVSADRQTAARRQVRLGRRNPKQIEVLEGLSPGEEIVTSSYTSYLEIDRLDLTPK